MRQVCRCGAFRMPHVRGPRCETPEERKERLAEDQRWRDLSPAERQAEIRAQKEGVD